MAFAGSLLGAGLPGLITPLLGMIPQAPGGPANPFAPTAGGSGGATSLPGGALSLGTQLYDQYGQPIVNKVGGGLAFLKSPANLLLIGGGVLLVIILIK